MCEEVCLIHGYEYMYQREISDPFRYCRMCEKETKSALVAIADHIEKDIAR